MGGGTDSMMSLQVDCRSNANDFNVWVIYPANPKQCTQRSLQAATPEGGALPGVVPPGGSTGRRHHCPPVFRMVCLGPNPLNE
jgi:hypothetical protein